MKLRHLAVPALVFTLLISTTVVAAPPKELPFTAEEDFDGAMSLWFFLNVEGGPKLKHAYLPAIAIPKSNRWLELPKGAKLQPADMAWWPNAVALRMGDDNSYIFKNRKVTLDELRRNLGEPGYRRFNTAEKPLVIILSSRGSEKVSSVPAGTDQYAWVFDQAINSFGPACTFARKKVVAAITDGDEDKHYEMDRSGCLAPQGRKVSKAFLKRILSEINK